MRICLATSSPHKLKEVSEILGTFCLPLELCSADLIGGMPEVNENARTYAGNAQIKARALAAVLSQKQLRMWSLADDSGLEVRALGNSPGIYSARYAGPDATDASNVEKLLAALENFKDRTARFVCSLVLISPEGNEREFTAACPGTITSVPKGSRGFGYDPVFQPEGFRATFAELSAGEKNEISHRALAIRKLADFLKQIPSDACQCQ